MLEFRLPGANSREIKKVTSLFGRARQFAQKIDTKAHTVINNIKILASKETPDFTVTIPQIDFKPSPVEPVTWATRYIKADPELRTRAMMVLENNKDLLNDPAYQPLLMEEVKRQAPELVAERGDYPQLYSKYINQRNGVQEVSQSNPSDPDLAKFRQWRQKRLDTSSTFGREEHLQLHREHQEQVREETMPQTHQPAIKNYLAEYNAWKESLLEEEAKKIDAQYSRITANNRSMGSLLFNG